MKTMKKGRNKVTFLEKNFSFINTSAGKPLLVKSIQFSLILSKTHLNRTAKVYYYTFNSKLNRNEANYSYGPPTPRQNDENYAY